MNPPQKGICQARIDVAQALEDLRRVSTQLTAIREQLPVTHVATAELRGLLEVVQHDLLADAIDTLALVAPHGTVSG